MIGCNQVKKQIDEADRPDILPFEANAHVASCSDCSAFADERARLRELLALDSRVTVPANFDAMLRARLKERTTKRTFSWFDAAFLWRTGAATAALIVVVAGAQYAGFFTGSDQNSSSNQIAAAGSTVTPKAPAPAPNKEITPPETGSPAVASENNHPLTASASLPVHYTTPPRHARHAQPEPRTAGQRGLSEADMPVVLVVARDGEIEVPMPTVSVGAQPLLYVNAGRQTPQNVKTTF